MVKIWDFDSTLNSPHMVKKLSNKEYVKQFNKNYNILITAREKLGEDQKRFIKKYGLKFEKIFVTAHKTSKVTILIKNGINNLAEINENNPIEILNYMKHGYNNITIYPPVSRFDKAVNYNIHRILQSKNYKKTMDELWEKFGDTSADNY